MSHLASADEKYNSYNNKQLKIFNKISDKYFKYNLKSLSNSAAIILGNDFHYDIARPGIALYGGHNNTNLKNKIKPVIKLKAEILQIKKITDRYFKYGYLFVLNGIKKNNLNNYIINNNIIPIVNSIQNLEEFNSLKKQLKI